MEEKGTPLSEYFKLLKDKEILQIIFLEGYFQIIFDRAGISCFSETFIKNKNGVFQIPSKEGTWELIKLINKEIISAEEKDNEVILKVEDETEISVNIRVGLYGDMLHFGIEGYPTKYY